MTELEDEGLRDNLHVVVGLVPRRGVSEHGFILVKQTFSIGDGSCRPTKPEKLLHDIQDPDCSPRLPSGSDYWLHKAAADIVVSGSAYSPPGKPTTRMHVSLEVGDYKKQILVWGDRTARIDAAGRVGFYGPAPFTEMPLTWQNAYGGIDYEVPIDPDDPNINGAALEVDLPGLYPRNPVGKGYVVMPTEREVPLPNLEDPSDPLTPDRLLVRDPKRWFLQPLSWCYEWMHPLMFPRCALFAPHTDAWFPGPEDDGLSEVRRRYLMPGYRTMMAKRNVLEGPHPTFLQEASHGLSAVLRGDELVRVRGMHPTHYELAFRLPGRPPIEAILETGRVRAEPRLTVLRIEPDRERVMLTWAAVFQPNRKFVPGIHKRIPIAASVAGTPAVAYKTPQTLKDELEKGKAEREPPPS
jgi:hypothetical protein